MSMKTLIVGGDPDTRYYVKLVLAECEKSQEFVAFITSNGPAAYAEAIGIILDIALDAFKVGLLPEVIAKIIVRQALAVKANAEDLSAELLRHFPVSGVTH